METTFNSITVDEVKEHAFKSSLDQAQIRQVIEKTYPSVNPKSGGLFDKSEFDLDEQIFTENRVHWIDVPKGTTAEEVEAKLAALPDARIYKQMSSKVILSLDDGNTIKSIRTAPLDQISRLCNNILKIDNFTEDMREMAVDAFVEMRENQQRVVNSETGEVILHGGKEQFRRVFFSTEKVEDIDTREVAREISIPRINLAAKQEQLQTVEHS